MHDVKVLRKRLDFASRSSALTLDRASELIMLAFKATFHDHRDWKPPQWLADSVRKRLMGLLVTEVRNVMTPLEDMEEWRNLLETMAAADAGDCRHNPSLDHQRHCERCMSRRLLRHMNSWQVEEELDEEEEEVTV